MKAVRRPKISGGAQMKDVAERAGVSISTVSHVVNNTREVATETRERVLRVLSELRYYKNAWGRRLARGSSDSVGLLISDFENPFFPEVIKSFQAAALEQRLDLFLCATNYEPERALSAVRRMIENRVQGVAVMTSQFDPFLVDELIAADIPVVRLDSGPARRGKSNIRIDYSGGAIEALTHLKELGHTRIGFIAGPHNRLSAVAYRDAVIEAFSRLDLPVGSFVEGNNDLASGVQGIRGLCEREAPTAVLCGSDLTAWGAVSALVGMGLRVPEDVSIVGADDVSLARFAIPALTTVRLPREQLGRMAFQALAKMLRNKKRPGAEQTLETHLVVRQSTGRHSRRGAGAREPATPADRLSATKNQCS